VNVQDMSAQQLLRKKGACPSAVNTQQGG